MDTPPRSPGWIAQLARDEAFPAWSDPWIEVDDVEMSSLDVQLRARRIPTDGSLGEFPMLPFVGSCASADRFSDLLP